MRFSLDQSLKRMRVDYVDIFYSHRFDPETPIEETMGALDAAVRQGKALYVGISSYSAERSMPASRRTPRSRPGTRQSSPATSVLRCSSTSRPTPC